LSQRSSILPSPFVVQRLALLAAASRTPGRGLDVAAGRGRHLIPLARSGYRTFGVDVRFDAIAEARDACARSGLGVVVWCADLERHPLPGAFFDVIVVTRYLQRSLFESLAAALTPGGALIYETFTTAQLALGTGPRSPEHLLRPGELRGAWPSLTVEYYEEVDAPEALARLVARRPR
jgi:SAM-dependent methyltransferase